MTDVFVNGRWLRLAPHERLSEHGRQVIGARNIRDEAKPKRGTPMKQIESHEVIVHGVEHAQYFQGCGVSFTSFEDVATGIGCDAAEAFDDALESLAQGDWDVEGAEHWDDAPKADDARLSDDDHEEMHVYVSVRVKGF